MITNIDRCRSRDIIYIGLKALDYWLRILRGITISHYRVGYILRAKNASAQFCAVERPEAC